VRLALVRERHDQRADPLPPAREPYREHAAHGLDLPVQCQLADDGE
jgi:hypothetical protein